MFEDRICFFEVALFHDPFFQFFDLLSEVIELLNYLVDFADDFWGNFYVNFSSDFLDAFDLDTLKTALTQRALELEHF